MKCITLGLCLALGVVVGLPSLLAQQTSTPGSTVTVPHLIRFAGVLKDSSGRPLKGVAGITFSLYREQEGGAALWLETQNATLDTAGRYDVLLGATHGDGVPMDLFTSGEARWLGIQIQGQGEEQPRVLLVSVPYALKAADAETVGGLPPSAFVLAAPPGSTPSSAGPTGQAETAQPLATGTTPVTTAGGTVNKLAKFDAKADITNSQIFDNGTNVGIGNTAPGAKLDVSGTGIFRGALSLPATGAANATAGKSSQPFNFTASSFNSGTAKAVNQTFRWQAEPTGNNTSSPLAKLNLLFSSGTVIPTETGLSISNKGIITFAPGQTFRGSGTVTSVALSAPSSDFTVSGSPVTSTGTLALSWNVAPTNTNTANAIVKRDNTGSFEAGSIFAHLGLLGISGVSGTAGTYGTNTAGGAGVRGFGQRGVQGDSTGVGVVNGISPDGVHGESHVSGGSGVSGFDEDPLGIGVSGSANGWAFSSVGNVKQDRTSGGWVKAMVFVNAHTAPYTIVRCFNSTLAGASATTPPCGFQLQENSLEEFVVDFGFRVNDRFLSVTPTFAENGGVFLTACTSDTCGVSPTQVSVDIWNSTNTYFNLIIF